MTTPSEAAEPPPTHDRRPPGPEWEPPETIAAVLVVAVGILALGGLAAGIVPAVRSSYAINAPGSRSVGIALVIGSEWSQLVLAGVLLGLIALCWWRMDEWRNAIDPGKTIHLERYRKVVLGIEVALALTAAGAVAQLVGQVLEYADSGPVLLGQDLYIGANALAVIVVSATGVGLGRRLTRG